MPRAGAIARLARGIRPDAIVERYHNFGGEAIRSARARSARSAVLEVNAPVIDHPRLVEGAARSRAARRADAALARTALRARRRHRHAERRDPAAGVFPRTRIRVLEWGADTERFRPGRRRTGAVRAARRDDGRGLRRRVPLLARRHPPGRRDQDACARAADKDIGAVLIGDGPELPRVREAAEGHRHDRLFTGALPHDRMPAALAGGRHRRRAVRHRRARAAVARVLLVAAEDLRVHGGGPAGRRARGRSDSLARRGRHAKGSSTIRRGPQRWPTRSPTR